MRDVNHVISKKIVSLLYDVFALESLKYANMRQHGQGRKFRKILGSWLPAELERFIKYKAEDASKIVVYVN
ncbi:MAG: hypothetical protein ACP5RZ_05425 [Thermoplasmata archaeon]